MSQRRIKDGLLGVVAVAAAGLVVACGADRPSITPNTNPPELSMVSEVPLFTQAKSLSLTIHAKSVHGVKHIWCAVNNASAVDASGPGYGDPRVEDGNWTCTATLAENSANVIGIWGEDYQGHSGVSGQPPYMQVLTVVHDDTALGVALNGAAQATYYDESKMTVGTETPPVYDRNGIGVEVVRPGETIHKASTRLASRTLTTSPDDLEAKNPDNLPWLQFGVSLSGSPVATATYTIDATAGGTTKTYTGDLTAWRSPQSSASAMTGTAYFDLPLDSVRIPMLASASGAVALKVTVAVADAAGNNGGDAVELEYAVIGPPLNIAIDSEYPKSGMRNSTYPYLIANGTYGTLFNASDVTTFGPAQQVRLVRLVVTNPAPGPVALDVSSITGGAWSVTENWAGNQSGVTGQATFNDQTCPGDNQTAAKHLAMYAPLGGSPSAGDPGSASVGWPGVAATSNLASLAELRDGSAVQNVGGRYIVPAADGSAPGVVSLYVTRPLVVNRSGAPALGASPYTNNVGTLYTYDHDINSPSGCCAQGYLTSYYWVYHYCQAESCFDHCTLYSFSSWPSYMSRHIASYCGKGPISSPDCRNGWWGNAPGVQGSNDGPGSPCTNCTGTCSCSQWASAQVYNLSTYYRQLSAATETVAGTLTPATQPTDDGGNLYGVANAGAASIAVNGSFTH